MTGSLLHVEDLTKAFAGLERKALDAVSFDVMPGRALGVVGPSGCGKSTLARAIMQVVPADAGTVAFDGRSWPVRSRRERRAFYSRLQMVFQNQSDAFDRSYTLGNSLREFGVHFGLTASQADDRAARLFSEVGLDSALLGRRPQHVSGGQCQRAAIARALMPAPDLLVCDEITSALDTTAQARVMEVLQGLKGQTTLLFITHDLALAQQVCDDLLVMDAGRAVECGPASQVLAHPQSDMACRLVAAAQVLYG